jgi:hypothetical protein
MRSPSNLVPSAVVKSDGEIERGILLSEIDGIVDQSQNLGVQSGARADHADFYAVLMQVGEIAPDEATQQAKQIVDFLFRARPVFR